MTWNYRSYGRSKGAPSPETLKEDIEAIYKFMRKEMGMKGKIGVYGRSLGGIPSSHISTKVDMAIIDRSFCNLSAMAYWKYRGHFADLLFKFGTCGWQVQNDYSLLRTPLPEKADGDGQYNDEEMNRRSKYLQKHSCYKVITADKNDEIVEF